MQQFIKKIGKGKLILLALAIWLLWANWPFIWKEEIKLSNGEVIEMRNIVFTRMSGPFGETGLEITNWILYPVKLNGDDKLPLWQSIHFSPILLDKDPQGKWFMVVSFQYCSERALKIMGDPKYSYATFYPEDGEWKVRPLDEKLLGRVANMTVSVSGYGMPDQTLRSKNAALQRAGLNNSYFHISEKKPSCEILSPEKK